jgi:hypothetical protein
MRAARPYHVNFPQQYADGSYPATQMFYEVVGHRDGPVVARFYFTEDESSREEALAEAKALCERSES